MTGLSFDPSQVSGRASTMTNAHLGQQVGDVVLDRLLSQKEIVSNFSVSPPGGDLLKDDPLALG